MPPSLARSYLYVPAVPSGRLNTAADRGADAVIVDLEDSVAVAEKATAVRNAALWTRRSDLPTRVERWVRVNTGEQGIREIADVFSGHLAGVCLPKVQDADYLIRVAELLDELESRGDDAPPRVAVMPLIETAGGLREVHEIARAPRVHRLQLGEIDLAADLGVYPGEDEAELAPVRSAIVVASAAAGLLPPVGAVSPQFRDLDELRTSTQRLRRSGFVGRAAIHPSQLATIHDVFAVMESELETARAAIRAYESAQAAGLGAILDEDGRMVDEAVIRRHRRTVALAAGRERESMS